jgi:hypothetical protein
MSEGGEGDHKMKTKIENSSNGMKRMLLLPPSPTRAVGGGDFRLQAP